MSLHLVRRFGGVLATVALAFGLLAASRIASGLHGKLDGADHPAPAAPAALGRFAEGDLLARVRIPRLEFGFPVLEGVDPATLARGAGHLPATSLPGEAGRNGHCLIALSHDARATRLSQLRLSDRIEVKTPFGLRHYVVVARRIVPASGVRLDSGWRARMTFVTPYPADSIGPAPLRLAILAEDRTTLSLGDLGDGATREFSLFRSSRNWLAGRSASPLRSSQFFHQLRDAIDRANL